MKAGFTTSVLMHAAMIGFGLFTLSAPRAFEVADVEALPVDIVPVESITQIQKGDKKAEMKEKPAPRPTTKPDIAPDAQEVGDNTVDLETPPTPEPAPKPVEVAALPEPSEEPAPESALEPEPAPQAEPEPAPVPATEVTPEPQPRQEVKPDSVPEAVEAQAPADQGEQLPDIAPAPQARPEPPKAQTAKAPERKDAEKPAVEQAAKPKTEDQEFDADQIAALLNKEKPSGGGADRSMQEASLGGRIETPGSTELTQSEMDALRGQLSGCWSIPVGAQDAPGLRASVRFNVNQSGKLEGFPIVEASSGNRQFDESTIRAIQKCDQNGLMLPKGKEDLWAEIVVNFDPAEMF
jgi:colicin import membrane protein